MPGAPNLWFLVLLCITVGEGGFEYIHCPKDFTESHIQNVTCYLNPHCPDKYVYLHTKISDEEYNDSYEDSCDFHVSPVSSPSGNFHVYWSDSEEVIDIRIQVDAGKNSEPIIFKVADGRTWAKHIEITIQKIEIHIDMSMDQNNHEVHITCNSNFEQLDNFDLIGPQVKIPDRYRHCEDNECRWTLEYPHIGEYHCEHTLDNYSITSNKTMIPSRNDNESTPITTYTSTDKNRIIIISVGIVGVALLIVSIAAITVSIVLCCIVKHHRYQRVPPNDPDGGGDDAGGDGAGGDGAGGEGGAAGADGGGGGGFNGQQ